MTTFNQHYDITASNEGFRRVMADSRGASTRFEKSIEALQSGVIRLSGSMSTFRSGTGKFISDLQALNSIGVVTTQQLGEQISVVDALIRKYSDDRAATAQLTAIKSELNSVLEQQTEAYKKAAAASSQGVSSRGGSATSAQADSLERLADNADEAAKSMKALDAAQRKASDSGSAVSSSSNSAAGAAASQASAYDKLEADLRGVTDAQQRQAIAQRALNQLGLQTQAQLQAQSALLDRLSLEYAQGSVEAKQLAIAQSELAEQLRQIDRGARSVTGSSKLTQFTLLNLGFVAQDLSQASQGLVFALRAVANNIDITLRSALEMIQVEGGLRGAFRSLAKSMKTPTGIVFALNLAVTAFLILESQMAKAKKEIEEVGKEARNAAAGILSLADADNREFEVDLDTLRASIPLAQERVDRQRELVELQERETQAIINAAAQSLNPATIAAAQDRVEVAQEVTKELARELEALEANLEARQDIIREEETRREQAEQLRQDGIRLITARVRLERETLEELKKITDELELQESGQAETINTRRELARIEGMRLQIIQAEVTESLRAANIAQEISLALRDQRVEREKSATDERIRTALLREELEFIQSAEGARLVILEEQNDQLEDQIERVRRLTAARAQFNRAEVGELDRSFAESREEGGDLDPFRKKTLLERLGIRKDPRGESGDLRRLVGFDNLRTIAPELQDLFRSAKDIQKEALNEMSAGMRAFRFLTVTDFEAIGAVASTTFGGFADLARAAFEASGRESERSLRQYKRLAIAEALINTFTAATAALRDVPFPYNIAAAAGVVASGLAQVRKIRSIEAGSGASGSSGGFTPPAFTSAQAVPSGTIVTPITPLPQSAIAGAGGAPVVDVNLNLTPVVLPSGDIVFAVEKGLENRAELGQPAAITVRA